jgi:hypothetical protein
METRKSSRALFGILVLSAWVLGSVTQAGAETMNYKSFSYAFKAKDVPVGMWRDTLKALSCE